MMEKQQEKFECMDCGCYFWVEDRDGFECPNCKQIELDNQENVKFTYLSQPPRKYTFEQPRLKIWTESWCKGKVLNLFAGTTKLNVDEFRVDINKDMIADFYGDAFEFIQTTELNFDTIVFDPPYNLRKAREKYEGKHIGNKNSQWMKIKPNVSLNAIHVWVKRRKLKPKLCEECKRVPPHDLANISGKYKRDIDDYEWLCRRCHMNKDGRINYVGKKRDINI